MSRLLHSDHDRNRQHRTSNLSLAKTVNASKLQKGRPPCYDWIFSSASNVHIAIDRSSFKTYKRFKSYVLTVSDHRQVDVHGIGSVDLDLRREKGSRQCHTITLENVLHVPSWMCSVFSDVHFELGLGDFEHTWGAEGVQFMKKKDEGKLRTWGFTEEFCGLDRLVLARNMRGRSPMSEDAEREIFSVNVNWPQGQRDRWEKFVEQKESKANREADQLFEKDRNAGRRSQMSLGTKA